MYKISSKYLDVVFKASIILACLSSERDIGILGQVWYLIVSIPDLCNLITFINIFDLTTADDWDCVAAVERLPALHYSEDFIFLSFGIMGFIVELYTIRGSLMTPKWQKLAHLAQEICTL